MVVDGVRDCVSEYTACITTLNLLTGEVDNTDYLVSVAYICQQVNNYLLFLKLMCWEQNKWEIDLSKFGLLNHWGLTDVHEERFTSFTFYSLCFFTHYLCSLLGLSSETYHSHTALLQLQHIHLSSHVHFSALSTSPHLQRSCCNTNC